MTPNRVVGALVLSGGLLLADCGARSALRDEASVTAGGSAVTSGVGGTTTSGQGGGGGATGGQGGGGSECSPPTSTELTITLNAANPINGLLFDPCFNSKHYSFCGKKGDILYVQTSAQSKDDNGFNPMYINTTVGISDAAQTVAAGSDDPITGGTTDAQLFTVLPRDGNYTIHLQESRAVDPDQLSDCFLYGYLPDVTNYAYTLAAFTIPAEAPGFTFDKEPDDTIASARPINYAKDASTQSYSVSRIEGVFDSTTDVDVYSFTIPTDAASVDPTKERSVGYFYLPFGHEHNNGSTAEIGATWIVDAMDPAHRVASVDASKDAPFSREGHEFAPPLLFGHPYYLFVSRSAGASVGANDFYFVFHFGGLSYPIEKADATAKKNDAPVNAEPLAPAGDPGYHATLFTVDGDISPITDVDFYALEVPADAHSIAVYCRAQLLGSGLRGLTISLFEADGATLLVGGNATSSEDLTQEGVYASGSIPGGASNVLLKVEGASQDPVVTSAFYRCQVTMD